MTHIAKQALARVKVLDFGWAIVGGLGSKYLGDHGAQVVRVESITRPDLARSNRFVSISEATNPDDKPWFIQLNTSKYSITINLKHSRAREVINRLIRWADLVLENYTPGAMTKLGYDYEYMRSVKPDIIMISGSAHGQTGPLAREWGIDGTGGAISGRTDLTGWPDRGPVFPSSVPYGDCVVGLVVPLAAIAALDYRRRTGKGQYIDVSMFDVCVHQIAPAVLDWQANKRLQTRTGNHISYAAPHNVFPCLGDDRWCAIAVFTDEEWESFCSVIGNPLWTKQGKFSTLKSRKDNEDELETLIAEWTATHSAEEIMDLMQTAGVPAGIVQNAQDLFERDIQLQERQFLVPLKNPVLGVVNHPTPPYKLLNTKAQVRTAPGLGEHTDYVCTQLLGMDDKEFAELFEQGIFE